jgi:hypothetical protein
MTNVFCGTEDAGRASEPPDGRADGCALCVQLITEAKRTMARAGRLNRDNKRCFRSFDTRVLRGSEAGSLSLWGREG